MAIVKPFAALRPDPNLAGRICELPYDVLSAVEARALAAGNPLSFFHVSKAEIDLDPQTDPHDPRVYAQARLAFQRLIQDRALRREDRPHYYLYRQIAGAHSQTGLVAVTSCQEYLDGIVRKHELTRPDKEDDRVRHIEALNAQTGPAFLVYPADPVLDDCFRAQSQGAPEVDFTAADGVRHSAWMVRDLDAAELIARHFAGVSRLYIADGHHRSAAAARVYQQRGGRGSSGLFLSVLFPHHQVRILPYHRVLRDLNGLSPERVLERLGRIGTIREAEAAQPRHRREVGVYLQGRWHTLAFSPETKPGPDPLQNLDVALLQERVLGPVFGIDNPRTSERIQFVGGIRGPAELERLVQSGESACAFAMFPTGIDELIAVADRGGLMPPKSTWFEPKLRDGMFSHLLEE